MQHLSDNRTRPNNRHLHHDVVKLCGAQAGQKRHLRAALHLEHADGVGLLQRGVDLRVARRQMRQVDFFAVVIANQPDGFLHHRHHAESEQIHFDDAHVGAIFFIPLHDEAARHGGGLQGHDGIELALADHHAAGVLSQVPRQILHALIERKKFLHQRLLEIDAGFVELALGGIRCIMKSPVRDHFREASQRFLIEAQHLADVARGGAAAVGDDVGGHGGAELPVALVDVLNGALAFVAAGEIEIDVGPLAAFFGKKALEQQIHADRIDGSDFERITHGAVGGRAAPLHQQSLLFAETNDVPDDQEIARQIELFDHGELALDLALGFFVIRAVALARAFIGELAQIRIHGLAGRDGVRGKLVAQIAERELQARRQVLRVGDGLGQIGEELAHLRGALEMALGIFGEQLAGFKNSGLVAHAGEGVEQVALVFHGVRDAVGCEQRQLQLAGDGDGGLVAMLLIAIVMALEFDEDVVAAEDVDHLLHSFTAETNQTRGMFGDVFSGGGGAFLIAMSGAQFDFGQQAAQVLIALARLGQQRVAEAFGRHHFGADDRAHAGFLRLLVEAHGARKTVAVEQRHGGRAEFGRARDQGFGQRRAFEKTESGAGVQLDVGVASHTFLRETSAAMPEYTRYRPPLLSSTSHSSRSQGAVVHQSPEARQGPAAVRIGWAFTETGRSAFTRTCAATGGR